MKQTDNPYYVYPISQNAKLILLDRLKQELTSKAVIDDVSKKRKRKSGAMTVGGSGSGDGDDARWEQEMASGASACTADGNLDASSSSNSISKCLVRSRVIVGINQCTRLLEKEYEHQQLLRQQAQQESMEKKTTTTATTTTTAIKSLRPKPSLLILSKDSLRPPSSILDHVTIYSRHLKIPTLVLPGRASSELGAALGMKCAAVALILSSSSPSIKYGLSGDDNNNNDDVEGMNRKQGREWGETDQDIDSFVSYAINKIPKL